MVQESDFTIVETPQTSTSPHAAYSSEPKRTSVLLEDLELLADFAGDDDSTQGIIARVHARRGAIVERNAFE